MIYILIRNNNAQVPNIMTYSIENASKKFYSYRLIRFKSRFYYKFFAIFVIFVSFLLIFAFLS